jgi:hypothetical protein
MKSEREEKVLLGRVPDSLKFGHADKAKIDVKEQNFFNGI